MFLYALMEMAASVSNIIRIPQITYEFVYYTLLVDQGRLFFCDSQVISNLFADRDRDRKTFQGRAWFNTYQLN